MNKRLLCALVLILELSFLYSQKGISPSRSEAINMPASKIIFTENKGQLVDMKKQLRPDILFSAKNGGDIYVRKSGVSYVLNNLADINKKAEIIEHNLRKKGEHNPARIENEKNELLKDEKITVQRIDMDFINGNPQPEIEKLNKVEGYENYYYSHCPQGIRNVESWNELLLKNIYNKTDVRYTAGGSVSQGLKYDFIVNPGGNPNDIKLKYSGSEKISLLHNKLYVHTIWGEIEESLPRVYQNINGKTIDVEATYVLAESNDPENAGAMIVSFKLGSWDPHYTLVIDPWASYFSGGRDRANAVTTDPSGNPEFSGNATNISFPVTTGVYQINFAGTQDAFVAKMNSIGGRIWATYFGGTQSETGYGIASDASGNVLMAALTMSADVPVSATLGNTIFQNASAGGGSDGLLLKLDATGACVWATYYGGSGADYLVGVSTDGINVFCLGGTSSPTGIASIGAYQTTLNGPQNLCLVKFSSTGNRVWGTYLGGTASEYPGGVTHDPSGNIYLVATTYSSDYPVTAGAFQTTFTGSMYAGDAALTVFNSSGNVTMSTYYGGPSDDAGEEIAVDGLGNIIIAGYATSATGIASAGAAQPAIGGSSDIFVAQFNAAGARNWATYLGGNNGEINYGIAVDNLNNIFISGEVEDADAGSMSVSACAYQPLFGGNEDVLLAKYSTGGQLICTSYIGGPGEDEMDGAQGNNICIYGKSLYIVGQTSGSYPTTPGVFQTSFTGVSDTYINQLCTNVCAPLFFSMDFTPSNVCVNTSVPFAPIITNTCDTSTKYNWTFTGATPSTSTLKNPSVIYSSAGSYSAKLVVTTFCQKDSLTKTIIVNPCTITATSVGATVCSGGCANVSASGSSGTAPYTYQWSTGSTAQTTSVCPVATTDYTVTVTDMAGNFIVTTATVIVPVITMTSTSLSNGCNSVGSASVSPTSGTAPYSYTWSDGSTGATATPLAAGNYTVTVSDAAGCMGTKSFVIGGTNPISATFTQSPAGTVCVNSQVDFTNTGSSGGSATYTWTISPTSPTVSGTTTNFSYTFLTAGSYSITHTITNAGCATTVISPINVIDCTTPTVTATGNTVCPGTCAVVTSSPLGGTAPYSYLWSNGATSQNINPCTALTATYTLTITDAASNTATTTATVTVNPAVNVVVTPTNINCFGGNGSAIANGSNGTAPYSYSWNSTQTTQTITALAPGNYTVTVTDIKGCTTTSTTAITQPADISFSAAQNTAATCGSNNGVAIATVATGGTGSITYSWSSGASGLTANTLTSGTYTVTATDAKGCTKTATAIINNSPAPVINSIVPTQLLCNGANTASAVVSATGTGALTYNWTNGNTAATTVSLNAGTYYVTVTDANGCNAISSVVITAPPAIAIPSITPVSATCGSSNGNAVATSSGGTGALTYNWSNLASGATVSGLAAGNYTVTVKDANGCTVTNTVAINNSGGPSVNSVIATNPLCSTGSGSATANASGGSGALTYTWSNTISGSMISGLNTGTYTVTVKDANGCANTSAVSIVVPSAISLSASQSIPASCGNNNGAAVTTAATGGTGTFSYLWSNAATGLTASSLTSGTYTVTATDANGCTSSSTAIINNNPAPVINSIAPTQLLCNGDTNASAVVSATGTGTLTYAWTNGNSGVTSSNLSAGTYYVTVSDVNGCNAISSTVITAPAAIVINSISFANSSCGTANGSAVATASGGTAGLTYSWSNATSGSTVSGLSAGTYTVTVTDANACAITSAVAIGSNNGPSIQSTTPVNLLCNGSGSGSAGISISGGSSPYTYSWSNGSSSVTSLTNNSITSLSANTYVVTITDNNNCSATTSFNITEPLAIATPTIVPVSASCGASDGSAVASTSGGTGSLTYSWSNTASGQTATALSSATYTVTVTDANGCSVNKTVSIGNSNGPSIQTTTPVDELCHGASTGSASVAITGGSAPYTYSWSNAVSSTTTSLNNAITSLPVNTYIVTITDNNNCSTTTSIIVTEPSAIIIPTISSTNSTCGNPNGSANAISTGGTGTLTYSWSSGAAGQTATNLSVQTYTVSVTDANACVVTKAITIGNDNAPLVSLSINSSILCNGGTGSITATATGGHPNYTYSWSSGSSSVTTGLQATLNNLTSAIYTVTITDVSGCSHTSSILLTEPLPVAITGITPVNSNCGSNTGSAIANASGGTGSLTYNWSNSVSGSTNTNLAANTYTITVSDANSCTISQTVTINNNGGPVVTSITPVDELCNGANTGTATVAISGGASPYTYSWSNSVSSVTNSLNNSVTNLSANTYNVTITDANGCQQQTNVTIQEPTAISVSIVPIIATCGTSSGSALASATGGSGNLTYSWSNSVSGQTNNGLAANTYILTVTDANACSKTQSVAINNSPAPTINGVAITNELCNGGTSGSAVVNASGGAGTLTYNWSAAGGSGATATGLAAGNYTVTVVDAGGCQQISAVTIGQPVAITINSINSTSAGCNKNDGTATATASGGVPLLTYTWSSGSTTSSATNLAAGIYTLTVRDANSCAVTNAVTINSTSGPTAVASVTSAVKCHGQTGSVTATASNGTAPYTYKWSTGASSVTTNTQLTIIQPAAAYTITITDNNGCSSSSAITLTEPALLTASSVKTDATCGNADGSVSVSVTGGTVNYTFTWSNGTSSVTTSLNASLVSLNTGTYAVTVTDANGCTASTLETITNSNGPVPAVVTSLSTIVEGNSTILIGSSTGNGVTYTWTPAASLSCSDCLTPVADPVTTTTYTLYVKDDQGCVDSSQITITVKKACSGTDGDIFIANVFSPNGDGKNDVLNIEGNAITNIYWAIYDRWGNMLFETSDQSHGWDGTKNGSPMESGTYVYYLKAICTKTKAEVKLKGNVSIVK